MRSRRHHRRRASGSGGLGTPKFLDYRGASVGASTRTTPILLGPPAPATRARKRIVAITHHHRAMKWIMAGLSWQRPVDDVAAAAVKAFGRDAEDFHGFVERVADAAFLGEGFDLGCGDWVVAFIWREFVR